MKATQDNTTLLGYMGTDQYGTTYHLKPKFPRKQLLDRLGYKSANKMYVDTASGESRHTGYVIGPYWVNLYQVHAFN